MSPELNLGPTEKRIMEVVWMRGKTTVSDVHQCMVCGQKKLAYTTVMTIMNRLTEKGLLERRKAGKAYRYSVLFQRNEVVRMILHDHLKALTARFGDEVLLALAEEIKAMKTDKKTKLINCLN